MHSLWAVAEFIGISEHGIDANERGLESHCSLHKKIKNGKISNKPHKIHCIKALRFTISDITIYRNVVQEGAQVLNQPYLEFDHLENLKIDQAFAI